jgi:hypothetical protein
MELCRFISHYDVILVQRCYVYQVVKIIRDACDVVGRKLIFETDDDYFNLPATNPCYPEMAKPGQLEGYAEILRMADEIWVSTKELKNTLYMYNRNIRVFSNNIESVMCGEHGFPARGHSKEEPRADGTIEIRNVHGVVTVPSYWERDNKKTRVVRIGYTGTPSHRADFMTIKHKFEKLIDQLGQKVWMVFIGDHWFYENFNAGKGRKLFIPAAQYSLYMYHLRNLDVGIAPLLPDVFNMSKSSIKAVEYGAWGIPAVLPHYITYTRDFTPGENCLTYYNQNEFCEQLYSIVTDGDLRLRLGMAARDYVRDNRLERHHSLPRAQALVELVKATKPAKQF